MERWEEARQPLLAAWEKAGYGVYFDADQCDPVLVMTDDEVPVAVLPAATVTAVRECMVAWCICELARRCLGQRGFVARITAYAHWRQVPH